MIDRDHPGHGTAQSYSLIVHTINMTRIETTAGPTEMSLGRDVQVPILGGDCDHLIHVAQSENSTIGASTGQTVFGPLIVFRSGTLRLRSSSTNWSVQLNCKSDFRSTSWMQCSALLLRRRLHKSP
jgi:hypothetical protein